jgi:signal transduction histidine kinase
MFDTAAARAALLRLRPDSGSLIAVDIRDVSGRAVFSAGRPIPLEERVQSAVADTAVMGAFHVRGEKVLYENSVPVRDAGRTIGAVVQIRRVANGGVAVQRLAGLIGNKAQLLIGNADGSVWTDLTRQVSGPPLAIGPVRYERDGRMRLAAMAPLRGTLRTIVVEFPEDEVLAPARDLMWRFVSLGALVVLVGALAGERLSRGITVPLTRLTNAAESIAAGGQPHGGLALSRRDEVGRLSRAFASMADSVWRSRDSLEHQIRDRTAALETALERLQLAQDELLRKERLATLGQLSSAIGHELRNPLGVMTNALYYLDAVTLNSPSKIRDHLAILRAQVRISETIVSDLLDHARVRPPERTVIDVESMIAEQLSRITIPSSIKTELKVQSGIPPMLADRFQVGQILVNLFTNAVQSMHDGGLLSINARNGDGRVQIEVKDSGHGVAPQHLERIFEPLFTTKARGIGLGLSVSRSLARANDGEITVRNHATGGAVFTLDVPAADRARGDDPPPEYAASEVAGTTVVAP